MKIKAYSVLTNLAAGLATTSVLYDAHKIGKNYSEEFIKQGQVITLDKDTKLEIFS